MKNEKVHGTCETSKLKKINRVLKILISIAISFFAILLLLGVGVNIAFYLLSFFCITGLFIIPLLEWIDMELKKYSIGNLFSIIISFLLSVMLCILLYFIFNVDSLGERPYYSLLNYLVIPTAFLAFLKVAVDHCLKIISVWNIEKEKTHLIIKESGSVLWMLIITLLLLYNIYVPKASIYLKNIKVPYEFKVERVNGQINMDNIFEDRNIGTIKDINLINEIYSEADKKQYKNIRNLDLINFEFEGKGRYPYYIIIPVYEGIGNLKIARLKDGFIERFEVSDSGQIVFNDEYIEFGIFRSISPKYRIHLDDSTKKNLVDAINSLK